MYSNFNFLCGRPHGAGPPPPVHMRPPEPDPLPTPCGRHKWMAPKVGPGRVGQVRCNRKKQSKAGLGMIIYSEIKQERVINNILCQRRLDNSIRSEARVKNIPREK